MKSTIWITDVLFLQLLSKEEDDDDGFAFCISLMLDSDTIFFRHWMIDNEHEYNV